MKIIIVGAGELGQYLTPILIHDRHDIIAVDLSDDILDRLKGNYDIMTVHGNGCLLSTLRKCGLKDTDLLVAVSGDEAANILSCQIASHFGVEKTICKLNSVGFFPEKNGFNPSDLKLKRVLVPAAECVDKIINVLDNKIILDQIAFSNPDALMTLFEIGPSSPLAGLRLKDFPGPSFQKKRFPVIMNFKAAAHVVSVLLVITGFCILSAAPVSWLMGDPAARDVELFILCALVPICAGVLSAYYTRPRQGKLKLGIREGFGIVTFTWLAAGIFGALPFVLLPSFWRKY